MMTNFEYYKDMIKEDVQKYEKEGMNSLQILNKLNEDLHFYKRHDFSMIGAYLKWLRKEYHPLYKITEFEKTFLENLSERNERIEVVRIGCRGTYCNLIIYEKGQNSPYCYLETAPAFGKNFKFKNLAPKVEYYINDILSNYVLEKE